ncbi:MAG: hypothetical protein KA007_00620 [Candidatus Pacebacteria bacterium]|nr:hypothetical protein [Candidatus Paceibacterota bacterium]
MITEELLSYIKKQLEIGHSEETVRKILIDHKWKQDDVDQAFSTVLGAKPQNTQGEVASIMRPGFSGAQPQQTSGFSQPQISQPRVEPVSVQPVQSPQTTFQPQPAQNTQVNEPIVKSEPIAEPQIQPQAVVEPVAVSRPEPIFQINPKLQQQFQTDTQPEPVTDEKNTIRPIEVKSEGPVFMPKTFGSKPLGEIQTDKKVQFGAVIQPNEVKQPEIKLEPESPVDANNDFYKSLTTNTSEVSKKDSGPLTFSDKKPETTTEAGRTIGQPMLKPKTFGPKVFGNNLQTQFNKMEPSSYGKFATPEAQGVASGERVASPVGVVSSDLYQKNKPESTTLREAQAKMPIQMASQANPNIVENDVIEDEKKGGGFFKKIGIILAVLIILGGAGYGYLTFFHRGISKDSKFMQNFQNVSSADFEITASGPVLSGIFPTSEDPNLLTAKIKAFVDVSDSSNKISNFEVNIKNGKELNFNVVSTNTASYAYTTYEDFSFKNQWIQLGGPFFQSFLPSMLSGTLPNGVVADSGAVLDEKTAVSIRQLFSKFPILTLVYEKGSEEINGNNVNVYSFELNKEALSLYLEQLSVLSSGSSGYESSVNQIKNLLSSVEVKEGTIWIDQNGLPVRIVAVLSTMGNVATSSLNIEINSYNQKQDISLPGNFIKPEITNGDISFAEGELKDSIRKIFVDLQSISNNFKNLNKNNFTGICQDASSGFSGRFKELETISPNITPICKDGSSGFLVGAKYSDNKYLCVDKSKITDSDEAGVLGSTLACVSSKESISEDVYTKETITAFVNIAKIYKTENQNSFSGLCGSQSYLIFSRGLQSAVSKTAQCVSTASEYSVFSPLSTGEYACVDATGKYSVLTKPATGAICK